MWGSVDYERFDSKIKSVKTASKNFLTLLDTLLSNFLKLIKNNSIMKKLFSFVFILFMFIACADNDRTYGFCYCDFANGEKQQYDLTSMSRQEQIAQTAVHDKNAAKFGGHCVLE
jgi:hypothetical protein